MGNYRLRLSKLIPNDWFYKLRDMARKRRQSRNSTTARSRKKKQQPSCFLSAKTPRCAKPIQQHSRKSHYFTRDLSEKTACSSPSKTQLLNKPETSSPPERSIHNRTAFAFAAAAAAAATKLSPDPDISTAEPCTLKLTRNRVLAAGEDDVFRPSPFRSIYGKQNDIVLEEPEPKLRPIITEPVRAKNRAKPASSTVSRNVRKLPSNFSPRGGGGVRLRQSSPRISGRRSYHGGQKLASSRRSLSDSFAIRKTSVDPFRDFKDSMMEMIVENNIKASKDFEELLACYLCLNSAEYHLAIIEAFKQILTDLSDAQSPAKNHLLKQV